MSLHTTSCSLGKTRQRGPAHPAKKTCGRCVVNTILFLTFVWREAQLTAWITSNTWDVGSYCVCLFVCLFVCSFVRSFVRLFVCLFLFSCLLLCLFFCGSFFPFFFISFVFLSFVFRLSVPKKCSWNFVKNVCAGSSHHLLSV